MKPLVIKDILSKEEIDKLKLVAEKEKKIRKVEVYDIPIGGEGPDLLIKQYNHIGRRDIEVFPMPDGIVEKFNELTQFFPEGFQYELHNFNIMYVEYSGEFGIPKLGPHYDGGGTSYMINYQIDSNIDWTVGIGRQGYDIKDNEALLFCPTEDLHWRPKIKFRKDQYLSLLFLRYDRTPKVKVPKIKYTEQEVEEIKNIIETYYEKKN